jgi:hypothetical protein
VDGRQSSKYTVEWSERKKGRISTRMTQDKNKAESQNMSIREAWLPLGRCQEYFWAFGWIVRHASCKSYVDIKWCKVTDQLYAEGDWELQPKRSLIGSGLWSYSYWNRHTTPFGVSGSSTWYNDSKKVDAAFAEFGAYMSTNWIKLPSLETSAHKSRPSWSREQLTTS